MNYPYKTGDRVEVVNNEGLNAKLGHKATVTENSSVTNKYVQLKWDRGGIDKHGDLFSQQDGGYYKYSIKLISRDWDD